MEHLYEKVIGFLVGILVLLFGAGWRQYLSERRENREAMKKMSDQITDIVIDGVGKTTLTKIQGEWRDDIRQLRMDLMAQMQLSRNEANSRSDRIENGLNALNSRIDNYMSVK